jgi:hypothetical protein
MEDLQETASASRSQRVRPPDRQAVAHTESDVLKAPLVPPLTRYGGQLSHRNVIDGSYGDGYIELKGVE